MAAITSRFDAIKRIAKGQAAVYLGLTVNGSGTAAAANSNFNTSALLPNVIGGTLGTTQQSIPGQHTLSGTYVNFVSFIYQNNTTRTTHVARIYKLGTLNLAATGDQFTHDSATFPITRTDWTGSSQPVTLIPIICVTTALTTTAAAFQLQTNAGAAGYTDQDGNATIGTKTFTMPSATTAVGSTYVLKLETGDIGVRDINQIKVTTAAATGAADVWGMEIFDCGQQGLQAAALTDAINSGYLLDVITAGSATSGTATTFLTLVSTSSSSNTSTCALVCPLIS